MRTFDSYLLNIRRLQCCGSGSFINFKQTKFVINFPHPVISERKLNFPPPGKYQITRKTFQEGRKGVSVFAKYLRKHQALLSHRSSQTLFYLIFRGSFDWELVKESRTEKETVMKFKNMKAAIFICLYNAIYKVFINDSIIIYLLINVIWCL